MSCVVGGIINGSAYNRFFWRSITHEPMLTTSDNMSAKGNPQLLASMPLTRFMPKSDDMSVGNISMIENDVSVRITVFMLLLMMEVYVSIVDSRISE